MADLLNRYLLEFDKPPKPFGSTKRCNLITLASSDLGEILLDRLSSADVFAVASAFRLGEIVRITWDDIDAEKRTVLIRDRKDPQRKMGNHQRVPLLEDAWLIVQAQPRVAGEDSVFPFISNAVSNAFAKACDALNIIDLTFHDLRHEAASRLFERGYQIQEVALITGHKNWNMLRRYTQLKAEDIHRNY
ncbi:MAG: site-specific integrase [Iodobacter sp.]